MTDYRNRRFRQVYQHAIVAGNGLLEHPFYGDEERCAALETLGAAEVCRAGGGPCRVCAPCAGATCRGGVLSGWVSTTVHGGVEPTDLVVCIRGAQRRTYESAPVVPPHPPRPPPSASLPPSPLSPSRSLPPAPLLRILRPRLPSALRARSLLSLARSSLPRPPPPAPPPLPLSAAGLSRGLPGPAAAGGGGGGQLHPGRRGGPVRVEDRGSPAQGQVNPAASAAPAGTRPESLSVCRRRVPSLPPRRWPRCQSRSRSIMMGIPARVRTSESAVAMTVGLRQRQGRPATDTNVN